MGRHSCTSNSIVIPVLIYLLYTLIEGKIRHFVADQSGCAKEKLDVFKFFITRKKHNVQIIFVDEMPSCAATLQ